MSLDPNGVTQSVEETSPSTADSLVITQTRAARLEPGAVQMLSKSPGERAHYIEQDRMIICPASKSVLVQAAWMFNERPHGRARGFVVTSKPGNGKSSLAGAVQRELKPYDGGAGPCVLSISMSGVRDARTVYGRLMELLGSPARISHRLSDREMLAVRLLKAVNCRLLVLDEVQDLLQGSEREQQRALEGIKFLMNQLSLPVLAFGTDKAAQAFASDPHLAARFTEIQLPAWKADNTLANFLATYERFLPLAKASNLAEQQKVAFLAKVSGGVLDVIVQRLQNAALMAIRDGTECITLQLLEKAVSRPTDWALEQFKGVK